MRVSILLALTLLAACDRADKPTGNRAAEIAAEAAGATDMAEPGTYAELAQWRTDMLRGCIGGGRDRVGPDVPVERHCECAIDRLTEGRSVAEMRAEQRTGEHQRRFSALMRQCIREISPDYPLAPER